MDFFLLFLVLLILLLLPNHESNTMIHDCAFNKIQLSPTSFELIYAFLALWVSRAAVTSASSASSCSLSFGTTEEALGNNSKYIS